MCHSAIELLHYLPYTKLTLYNDIKIAAMLLPYVEVCILWQITLNDEEIKMTKLKDLTIDELEYLIEQKILEVLGDPDSGLELREEFKEELKERLKNPSRKISHEEVVKRLG